MEKGEVIWTTCTTFFRHQNSRFEGQLRNKQAQKLVQVDALDMSL